MKIGLLGLNALEQSAVCAWGLAACPDAVWLALESDAPLAPIDALVCTQTASQRHGPWPEGLPVAVLHNKPAHADSSHRVNGQQGFAVIDAGHGPDRARAALSHWLTSAIASGHRPTTRRAPPLRDRQHFSKRETEVLNLLSQGLSNDQISASLNIRTATVKTYLRRIFERTGAVNRTHAVSLYRQVRAG